VRIRFSVRDTGVGIPPERSDRLFKTFSQLDASTTRKHGGTGLGLAICKQIVTLMDGEIGVESEVGKGSEFWFECRFRRSSPPVEDAGYQPRAPLGTRALVVAHNKSTLRVLRESLESLDAQVSVAPDQQSACEGLVSSAQRGIPYTVAIVDEDCSHGGDINFYRSLRRHTQTSGTCLILLTATDDANHNNDELVDVRLRKPLRQSQLCEAICGRTVARLAPPEPTRVATTEGPTRSARILVAEDNEINQIVTTQVLSKVGYLCDLVANGKEALTALESKQYDLVLMDCQMPEMDGFEATRQYRSLETTGVDPSKPVPIIALTANAMRGDRERCLEAGMTDYLTKPIDPIKLIDLVQQYLDEAIGAT
jgi:CheY-like chemotaxis protein